VLWILWQIFLSLVIIAGLMAFFGGSLYLFSMLMLRLVGFFPAIGKKHRHRRWQELTKHSARGGPVPGAPGEYPPTPHE